MTGQDPACREFLAHLESYWDEDFDRAGAVAHMATCQTCRDAFDAMLGRLRDLPCREFVELVTDYLERSLPMGERARLDQHLALCEGCRRYLDQMRETMRLVGRAGDRPPESRHLRSVLRAAFEAHRERPA